MLPQAKFMFKIQSFALCHSEDKDFTLKAQQREAVKHVWDGKDVFLLLPNGLANLLPYNGKIWLGF